MVGSLSTTNAVTKMKNAARNARISRHHSSSQPENHSHHPHLGLVQMTSVDLVHILYLASAPTSGQKSLLLGLHGGIIIDGEQGTATFRQVLHHDLPKAVVGVPGEAAEKGG